MWFTPVTNQLNGGMMFQVGTPWCSLRRVELAKAQMPRPQQACRPSERRRRRGRALQDGTTRQDELHWAYALIFCCWSILAWFIMIFIDPPSSIVSGYFICCVVTSEYYCDEADIARRQNDGLFMRNCRQPHLGSLTIYSVDTWSVDPPCRILCGKHWKHAHNAYLSLNWTKCLVIYKYLNNVSNLCMKHSQQHCTLMHSQKTYNSTASSTQRRSTGQ